MTEPYGRLRIGILTLTILGLFLFPMLVKKDYYLNLIFLVNLYLILAHSWNVIGGLCGQISLGHAAFFGVGALSCRYAWIAAVPSPVALLIGGLGALLLACLIGIPALKLRSHYFAIATLAIAMIALITVQNQLPGVNFLPAELMAGYSVVSRYYLCLVVGIAAVVIVHFLKHSKLGLAMISVREEEDAAESIGINVFRFKVVATLISAVLAGISGGLFAIYYVSFYNYIPFELTWSFDPVLITFIGGSGTVIGPVLGSICYVILRETFAISMGQLNVIIFGTMFILIVLFFPTGLIGMIDKVRHRSLVPAPARRRSSNVDTS